MTDLEPGMVAGTCNTSTREMGEGSGVQGQPVLPETLSQETSSNKRFKNTVHKN